MDFINELLSIEDADVADCLVLSKEGNAVCIFVMAGPMHEATRKFRRKTAASSKVAAERARDPMKAISKQWINSLDPDTSDETEIDELRARVVGWKAPDGSPASRPFNTEDAEKLYARVWFRQQLLGFLRSGDSFMTSSPTK